MSNRKVNPDSLRQVTRYINEYSQHIWDNELTGDKEFVRVKEMINLKLFVHVQKMVNIIILMLHMKVVLKLLVPVLS